MTSSFSYWYHSNSWIETKLFLFFFLPFPAVSFIVLYHCPVGMLAHWLWEGKKRLTSTIPQHAACMQTTVMIFYWRLLGGNVTGRLFWAYFFLFCLFVCLLVFPPASPLAVPFPQVLVLRLADRRIVLPRDINYSLFFVNSFPKQMLVHHILVIKQITSGAAEHKLCLVLPPNIRQTEMTLVLLEPVAASPNV